MESTGITCGGEMKWDHKKIKVNKEMKLLCAEIFEKKSCNNFWHDQF